MSSDEEMPRVGGEFDGDFDDDTAMPAGDELPEGVKKEIVVEAGGWKTPKPGDEVTVHYVGTLESDGTEFDSSRKRDEPFVFSLGKGAVIKGWDLGVATMKKGEVAKFTLAPEYAYGASGSPPSIPANATLVFEVELISWQSKDDLFGDEGVIKSQVQEGTGYKTPKLGDEVKISLKAVVADGSIVEEHTSIDYVLGSDKLGMLGKAVDGALKGMKKGEEATLKCTKDYAYGDKHADGATLNLTLEEMYQKDDVSFRKGDKAVVKKQIKEGEGYDKAKDGAKVTMRVSAATDGTSPLPGFTPTTLEFAVGNGEVCDALECLAVEMKRGEHAVVTLKGELGREVKLGLEGCSFATMVFTVELVDFEKGKDVWDMSEEEKLEFGTARKEVGNTLLKADRLHLALERYKKVAQMFSYCDNYKEENKAKAKALKQACDSNKAAVFLKLGDWKDAVKACEDVLKDDKNNVKAIFRRGQAQFHLKNFAECIADCKKVLELDSATKDARLLHKRALAGQKEEDKKAKGLFANMCKALGKGHVPQPAKPPKMEDTDEGKSAEGDSAKDSKSEAEEPVKETPAKRPKTEADAEQPVPQDCK